MSGKRTDFGTTVAQSREPLMIVISGPSGVGKDSVVQGLKVKQRNLQFIVTATTRPRRETEVDGIDYIFMSVDQFKEMIEQDAFLEHALVYKDYKGIPKDQVQKAMREGKDVILRVDVQGADTVRQKCPQSVSIFIAPVSEDELIARLKARNTETEEQLNIRIATARDEMKRIGEFDYAVVNQNYKLDDTVDAILAIIQAERHRVQQHKVSC